MSIDVTPQPCNHKAILILASFTRHFDSQSKKKTRRNKSQVPTVAGLAQSVERLTAEREVAGSIPGAGPLLRVLK